MDRKTSNERFLLDVLIRKKNRFTISVVMLYHHSGLVSDVAVPVSARQVVV